MGRFHTLVVFLAWGYLALWLYRDLQEGLHQGGTFPGCWCQCPHPCGEPFPTHTSTGRPSNTSRYFWFSLLWSHCSFPLSLGAGNVLFVPSKTGVSFTPGPVKVLQSNPTGLQVQIPWGFPVRLSEPQAGKPDVGLITFTKMGEILWYYCSPVCGSPTWLRDNFKLPILV